MKGQSDNKTEKADDNHLIQERLRKLEELRKKANPYPYSFKRTATSLMLQEKYTKLNAEEQSKDTYSAAGRIIALRRMGKITFCHILDGFGKVQLYFKADNLTDYETLKLFDMGDFIGVHGNIFKTKTGEVTVNVSKFEMLAKSIRPLPEKYHGLQDTELRYRLRYLDLIFNNEVRKAFELRSRIMAAVREFYASKGFMEVETPTLQPIYGGANARPFKTHHNTLNMPLYLRIALELYHKRLVIGGFERVFEIGKCFRNEGIDTRHNPEFTMLESYQAYADYNEVMDFVEDLYSFVAMKALGKTKISYGDTEIDLKKPWKRVKMLDAIKQYGKIDVSEMEDAELRELVVKNKLETKGDSRGDLIVALFEHFAEKELIQPTFIIDHPEESTPFCKETKYDKKMVERFELFINGMECANAYSELNDPIKQRQLLEAQANLLRAGSEESHPMDEDFIQAMEYAMPPTGGLGIGIDRMIMLLTDSQSIRDVIFFPTMKP